MPLAVSSAQEEELTSYELENKAENLFYAGSDQMTYRNWDLAIRQLAQSISIFDYVKRKTGDDWKVDQIREKLMEAYDRIAMCRLNRDGFTAARASFQRHLDEFEAFVGQPDAHSSRKRDAAKTYERFAKLAEEHGDDLTADAWFKRAAELGGKSVSSREFYDLASREATRLLKRGEVEQAEAKLLEALDTAGEQLEGLKRSFELVVGVADLNVQLARVLMEAGQFGDAAARARLAIGFIGEARELAPDLRVTTLRKMELVSQNLLGESAFRLGNPADAETKLVRSLALTSSLRSQFSDPEIQLERARTWLLRAQAQAAQGWDGVEASEENFRKAAEALQAMDEPTERSESHRTLADYGHWAVEQLLVQKEDLDENDHQSSFDLGEGVLGENDLVYSEEMREEAAELLRKIPKSETALFPMARLILGEQEQRDGNWEAALTEFELALPLIEAEAKSGNEDLGLHLWRAHIGMADSFYALERFSEADLAASKALRLSEDLTLFDAARCFRLLAFIKSRLGDNALAYEYQLQYTETLIDLYDAKPESARHREILSNSFGSLSWQALFAEEYSAAIDAAKSGLELKYQRWIAGNLAHGLLLSDRYDEALEIYERHRGQPIEIGREESWEEIAKEDYSLLREAGIEHPDMVRIERELGIE